MIGKVALCRVFVLIKFYSAVVSSLSLHSTTPGREFLGVKMRTFHFVYIHICKNKTNLKIIHCFIDDMFRFHLVPVQKDDAVSCPRSQIIPVFWPFTPFSPSFPMFSNTDSRWGGVAIKQSSHVNVQILGGRKFGGYQNESGG